MAEFFMMFALKINKILEFYTIIARKIFSRFFFWGGETYPIFYDYGFRCRFGTC